MPTDNPRAEEAFVFYASLPPEERAYAAVAAKFGVSLPTVKRWGSRGHWRERVGQREIQLARKVADRTEANEVDARYRHSKVVELGLMRLAGAIAKGEVRGSFSDLDRLVRLEGWLKGTDRALPIEEVRSIFEYFLSYIEQEIHDPEQRQRIAAAVRRAIDAAQAPRRLGESRRR